MSRRVVRVRLPKVYEYDVVFEDGEPVYVGAVITRPSAVGGPHQGALIDTHRTTWDVRGHELVNQSLAGQAVALAADVLADPGARPEADPPVPVHVGRPFEVKIHGRPSGGYAEGVHRMRRQKLRAGA